MRELVKAKRRLHEMYLRTKSEYKNEYNKKNREVKYIKLGKRNVWWMKDREKV